MNNTEVEIEISHSRTHNDLDCGRCSYGVSLAIRQHIQYYNTVISNPTVYPEVNQEESIREREELEELEKVT